MRLCGFADSWQRRRCNEGMKKGKVNDKKSDTWLQKNPTHFVIDLRTFLWTREFEYQSCYYLHFRINTLGKSKNFLIPSSNGLNHIVFLALSAVPLQKGKSPKNKCPRYCNILTSHPAKLSNKKCTCVNNRSIRSKISGDTLDCGRVELGADATLTEAGGSQTII